MVKGVNKTVIVVNDTGNEMFEKIVFYVSPKYGNSSSNTLQKAVGEFNFDSKIYTPLRKRARIRKGRVAAFCVGFVLLAGIIATVIIF